jgi:hypothetical protein
MNDVQVAIESSLSEVDRLRAVLKKSSSAQVRSADERSIVKAIALSWFNAHRPKVVASLGDGLLAVIDSPYRDLLTLSDKNTTRKKYDIVLKSLHKELAGLRSQNIIALSKSTTSQSSSDQAPDFSVLISDTEMQAILSRRWDECAICISSKAPLAATVMMGGLLEALLLARINQLSDKGKVFKASSAPRNRKTGDPLPLNEWGLKDYIDVAHEIGWISRTEKDLGEVLRDYRNYIHPYKERSHGVKLEPKDAGILWELSKTISRELLSGVGTP